VRNAWNPRPFHRALRRERVVTGSTGPAAKRRPECPGWRRCAQSATAFAGAPMARLIDFRLRVAEPAAS